MSLPPVNDFSDRAAGAAEADPPGKGAGQAGVGLLRKAFSVLDCFTEEHPGWTQGALARQTGLSRSTLGRLVRFLASQGYLLEREGRYSLGFAAVDLGRRAQAQFDLVGLCQDLLLEVSRQTAETVILTGLDELHERVVCLSQIPSRRGGLRLFENLGNTYPLHSGATGKAVLAFLPEARIAAVLGGDLTAVNPACPPDAAALQAELPRIRAQGFAVTREETYPGVTGIAVPLLTPRGAPLGSIGMAGPAPRMGEAELAGYAQALREAGRRVTARMAGQG